MDGGDVVFVLVVAARLLVPLGIPRFPVPAIVAALVIDAVDQTIFQQLDAEPPNYQSYDKALDVYYLSIAYVATLRNWADPVALGVARFLFYYRLVGVLLFELTETRAVLLVFPNTFEYFFIAYEAVRILWRPSRLGRRQVIGLAAGIWVVIKLPQEWWIHVAQRDVTDTVREHPWLLAAGGLGLALLVAAAFALRRRLPPPEWAPTFDADAHVTRPAAGRLARQLAGRTLWTAALAEKVVLIAMVVVIFSQVLPSVQASGAQLTAAVALVVIVNAAVADWRRRQALRWRSTLLQFALMVGVNAVIIVGASLLFRVVDARFPLENSAFFLLLLSLMVTLYDRYRVMGEVWRRDLAQSAARSR